MAVKGKSAKGVIVDFDLLRIKEQMASAPPSIDVQKRQDFIESRMRRRARKKVPAGLLEKANEKLDVAVDKELPSVEGEVGELIEEPKSAPKKSTTKTRQNARPKTKTTK